MKAKVNFILNISKKEAKYLLDNGICYGGKGLFVTSSKHSGKQYRVCETGHNKYLLSRFRRENITISRG